jgi:outer membrane lipopolysaccharide assembly protein LptE/RlpB
MKRLSISILALIMLIGLSGCSDDTLDKVNKELKMCALYDSVGAVYPPTLQQIIDNKVEVTATDENNIVLNYVNANGDKTISISAQKIDINNRASCYAISQVYLHGKAFGRADSIHPKQMWATVVNKLLSNPEKDYFKTADIK